MLRRLSVIAASAAMLAASALPAFATTHTSTHKLAFPGHSGISAWGNYKKTNKGIYVNVCAKDTKSQFAVPAVVVAKNKAGGRSSNLGAVAMGHNNTQCRFGTIPYSSHLKTYVIGYTSHGTIAFKTSLKQIFYGASGSLGGSPRDRTVPRLPRRRAVLACVSAGCRRSGRPPGPAATCAASGPPT